MTITTAVHEIRHHVNLNVTDAPPLTNLVGHTRTPIGVRLDYVRSGIYDRVDITVEYEDCAERWEPVAEVPAWLQKVIDQYQPAALSQVPYRLR